jgi:hypothetical protein
METLLTHFKTVLEGITTNTGTEEEPVLTRRIKEAAIDEGQLEDKVTLQIPATYFDITDMAYSAAGENLGLADTEVTVRLAVRKNDATRYSLINSITKALVGSHGTNFSGIMKERQVKVSYDDIFEYRITFGCMLYDTAAIPEYTTLEETEDGDTRPELKMNFNIKKPGS